MHIPTQRSAKHDEVHTEERCAHEVCNRGGFFIRPEEVSFLLSCLVKRGKLTVLPDGKYALPGEIEAL